MDRTKDQEIEGQIGQESPSADPLLLNVSDDELIREIEDRIKGCEAETGQLRKLQQKGIDYYEGLQLKSIQQASWQLEHINNRIYTSIETLIPLVTTNPGDPVVSILKIPSDQKAIAQNYAETLTCMCLYDYNHGLRLKDTLRMILRDWYTCLVGVGKFRYDTLSGSVIFERVDPRNIYLPAPGQPRNWVIEYIKTTVRELLSDFPKAKSKIQEKFWKKGDKLPDSILGTEVGYFAYWRDSFCAFKLDDIILDKKLNPHWDWEGEEKNIGNVEKILKEGEIVLQPIIERYKYRILDRPRHPYFFFSYNKKFGLDYDRTGPLFQAIPIQDNINERKRQISRVASDTGILVASGDAITEQEWRKYDGSPLSTFWARPGIDINRAFTRLPGARIDQTAFMDLQDSRGEIDNIFGTQNVTRGIPNSAAESGVAREILRQADISRVGPLAETLEDYLQQIYLYLIQMRMLFSATEYNFPNAMPTDEDDYDNKVFDREKVPMIKVKETIIIDGKEMIEEYMKPLPLTLTVRRNSTLPKDQISQLQKEIDLIQAGLSDPLTVYEKMGDTNPAKRLTRLIKYQTNPLSLLPEDKRAEVMDLQAAMTPLVSDEEPPVPPSV